MTCPSHQEKEGEFTPSSNRLTACLDLSAMPLIIGLDDDIDVFQIIEASEERLLDLIGDRIGLF